MFTEQCDNSVCFMWFVKILLHNMLIGTTVQSKYYLLTFYSDKNIKYKIQSNKNVITTL